MSLSIRVQTGLNHFRFIFYYNIDVIHVWELVKALQNSWREQRCVYSYQQRPIGRQIDQIEIICCVPLNNFT